MLKTRKRQAPPVLKPTAQDVHAEVADEHRELVHRIDGLRAVIALDNLKNRKERESDRFSEIRKKAAPFNGMRRRKAVLLLEDAQDDLEAILARFNETADAARRAKQREVRERARKMQPAHRAVVARIADALENLTEALAEEGALRQQCTDPTGVVPADLPDMGFLHVGLPCNFASSVSEWGRRARRAGFLE